MFDASMATSYNHRAVACRNSKTFEIPMILTVVCMVENRNASSSKSYKTVSPIEGLQSYDNWQGIHTILFAVNVSVAKIARVL